MKNSRWAVMWNCHGLEAIARVPDPADVTFALLKNQKPPQNPNIMHWQLRARFNSQQHYEIYIFDSERGIERDDIVKMFNNNPQHAADTIRRIGHCYYSNRAKEHLVEIQ